MSYTVRITEIETLDEANELIEEISEKFGLLAEVEEA